MELHFRARIEEVNSRWIDLCIVNIYLCYYYIKITILNMYLLNVII